MGILVLDTETTGLDGHPTDYVVEISICEVDIHNQTVDIIYDNIVGYDTSKWKLNINDIWIFNNSSLSIDLVNNAKDHSIIINEVRAIVKNKVVTSYNIDYDFGRFLDFGIWGLQEYYDSKFDCIMMLATEACKIPGYYGYKWPRLEEAVNILNVKTDFTGEFHRSLYDTVMSSHLLLKLLSQGDRNAKTS